jgi:hypothetical protein
MRHSPLLLIIIFVLFVETTCRQRTIVTTVAKVPQPTPSPLPMLDPPEITVTEFLRQQDQAKNYRQSSLVGAWKTVPNWNHYRWARSTDFKMPEWIQLEGHWRDVEREINDPDEDGEMGGAHGLAAIFIDRTVSDSKGFSCVVFIFRPGNRYHI